MILHRMFGLDQRFRFRVFQMRAFIWNNRIADPIQVGEFRISNNGMKLHLRFIVFRYFHKNAFRCKSVDSVHSWNYISFFVVRV